MKIKILNPKAVAPTRGSLNASGFDLKAILEGSLFLHPGAVLPINTGLALEIPEGWTGLVLPRSGLGTKHGINLANTAGVIDPDYRGELIIQLYNRSNTPFEVKDGDRVAQLVLVPRYTSEIEVVEELSNTERGEGGFGSTGI